MLKMLLWARYRTVSFQESWGVSGLYERLFCIQLRPCFLDLCTYLSDCCRGCVQKCSNFSLAGSWGGQDICAYDEDETWVQNFSWKTWRRKHKWYDNIKQNLKQYVKWLVLVRDRFSAAYCERLQYLSDCHILKKYPAFSSFVSVAHRGGVHPPPEIPKFWQSRTQLQIERIVFSVPIPKS